MYVIHPSRLSSFVSAVTDELVCFLRPQVTTVHLLAKPSVYTAIGGHASSYAAPQIWNAIPLNIHISPSVSAFKSNLKTYFAAAF